MSKNFKLIKIKDLRPIRANDLAYEFWIDRDHVDIHYSHGRLAALCFFLQNKINRTNFKTENAVKVLDCKSYGTPTKFAIAIEYAGYVQVFSDVILNEESPSFYDYYNETTTLPIDNKNYDLIHNELKFAVPTSKALTDAFGSPNAPIKMLLPVQNNQIVNFTAEEQDKVTKQLKNKETATALVTKTAQMSEGLEKQIETYSNKLNAIAEILKTNSFAGFEERINDNNKELTRIKTQLQNLGYLHAVHAIKEVLQKNTELDKQIKSKIKTCNGIIQQNKNNLIASIFQLARLHFVKLVNTKSLNVKGFNDLFKPFASVVNTDQANADVGLQFNAEIYHKAIPEIVAAVNQSLAIAKSRNAYIPFYRDSQEHLLFNQGLELFVNNKPAFKFNASGLSYQYELDPLLVDTNLFQPQVEIANKFQNDLACFKNILEDYEKVIKKLENNVTLLQNEIEEAKRLAEIERQKIAKLKQTLETFKQDLIDVGTAIRNDYDAAKARVDNINKKMCELHENNYDFMAVLVLGEARVKYENAQNLIIKWGKEPVSNSVAGLEEQLKMIKQDYLLIQSYQTSFKENLFNFAQNANIKEIELQKIASKQEQEAKQLACQLQKERYNLNLIEHANKILYLLRQNNYFNSLLFSNCLLGCGTKWGGTKPTFFGKTSPQKPIQHGIAKMLETSPVLLGGNIQFDKPEKAALFLEHFTAVGKEMANKTGFKNWLRKHLFRDQRVQELYDLANEYNVKAPLQDLDVRLKKIYPNWGNVSYNFTPVNSLGMLSP